MHHHRHRVAHQNTVKLRLSDELSKGAVVAGHEADRLASLLAAMEIRESHGTIVPFLNTAQEAPFLDYSLNTRVPLAFEFPKRFGKLPPVNSLIFSIVNINKKIKPQFVKDI